jgi:hypothetical protein
MLILGRATEVRGHRLAVKGPGDESPSQTRALLLYLFLGNKLIVREIRADRRKDGHAPLVYAA